MALADVNGDGKLDVVAGSNLSAEAGTQSAVYLNDGAGRFSTAKSSDCTLPENANTMRCFGRNDAAALIGRVAAGDLDEDGRPDVVVAYRGGANAVYLNSAQGAFSASNSFMTLAAPARSMALEDLTALSGAKDAAPADGADRSLTLADVNADGALDIITGKMLQGSYVDLNDGAGTFDLTSAVQFGTDSDAVAALAAGDVDSDGDLDLAMINDDQRSAIHLNDGAGTFPRGRSFGSSRA